MTYEFINKLDEDSYCKPWLKVTPYKAVIMPGESYLTLYHTVQTFNDSREESFGKHCGKRRKCW